MIRQKNRFVGIVFWICIFTSVFFLPVLPSTAKADNEAVEFLTGTWMTASQGYEYYGEIQPEYYVRFTRNYVKYGHLKSGKFILDHKSKIVSTKKINNQTGYRIKVKADNGYKYCYQTSEDGNVDSLDYYMTWNESEFPGMLSGSSSLERIQ